MKAQKSLQGLKSEEKVRQCPECKSTNIDSENGEMYCKKCGLVLD